MQKILSSRYHHRQTADIVVEVFKDGKEGVLRMHERLNGQLSSYLDIIEITLFGQISLCHNFIESLSNLSLIQVSER